MDVPVSSLGWRCTDLSSPSPPCPYWPHAPGKPVLPMRQSVAAIPKLDVERMRPMSSLCPHPAHAPTVPEPPAWCG
eukprot:2141592-Amphidinium_carterae.1